MGAAQRGLFLTLEGVDGAGKSTQSAHLAQHLRATGRSVMVTREPGGSPGAEAIRRLLLDGAGPCWSVETELLLFTAARRDHLERVIAPALAEGRDVICDRYVDSTRAYQGMSDPATRARLETLHALMIGLDPDLTLVLDVDPDAARARGTDEGDRFEARGAAFQRTLAASFRALAAAEPGRMRIVDAAADVETVAARVAAAVDPLLAGR